MAAERGSAFLLKIGDGSATPVYATVAGLKTTQLSINGDAVAITNKGSGGWRELLSGAGVRSVSVAHGRRSVLHAEQCKLAGTDGAALRHRCLVARAH